MLPLKKVDVNQTNYRKIHQIKEEAKIQSMFNHGSIVNLIEIHQDPTHIYIIEELIQGPEIFEKLTTLDHFSELDTKHIMKTLFEVLIVLENQSIIHRDLKLENLLLEHPEKNLHDLKLADFGCATKVENVFSGLVGSLEYMAPEVMMSVITNEKYDTKVDIWSCGIILFVCLSGSYPFQDDDQSTVEEVKNILAQSRRHNSTKKRKIEI